MKDTRFNFTPRARRVLALARAEAGRFGHDSVGAEHLLLGVLDLGEGVAVQVLGNMGLDLQSLRFELEKQIPSKTNPTVIGNIPHSLESKKVLAVAEEERNRLNHSYAGTEHILLGILRADYTAPCHVLNALGVEAGRARSEVARVLALPE